METNTALNPNAWTQAEAKSISTEDLDNLVLDMKRKRDAHDVAKAKSTELYKEAEKAENALLEALRLAGKKKYHVDDIGTASVIEKLVYRVPPTIEDKAKFFEWLSTRHGPKFLLDKQSVNSQSLQKICNDAFNEEIEAGRGAEFKIPGLADPTPNFTLSFRKG